MSGRLPDAWLEELRSRVSLEEVVSEYVPLKQKGRRLWACCPFHNEKTPSFSVDSQEQLYYCFGCHKGGTVIQFVMDMERMEFMDAVRYLAERAHMQVPDRGRSGGRDSIGFDERERLLEANRVTARYYHDLLWTDEGAAALNYLYSRGLTDSDIRRFGLGASPQSDDGVMRYLKGRGFEERELETAGLVVRRNGNLGDMFHNRVMFPIISAQGKVLGFGGRAMGNAQPKYLNTAETVIFNKRLNLYGLNFVRSERHVGRLVLVEGYMDTLSLRKWGVQGVVATLGTALTEDQAKLMKRYASEVWVSYDGDPPGQKAALRALDILDAQGLSAKVLDYPDGMDPDDFIKANGLSGFEALPRHDSTTYRMLRAKDGLDMQTQEGVTQYAMLCCEILKNVKSPIDMENHLRKLVNETGYDRDVLLRQIGAIPLAHSRVTNRRRVMGSQASSGPEKAERELITMLASGLIPREMLRREDFIDPAHQELAGWLIEGGGVQTYVDSITDDAQREKVMQALNYTPLPMDRERALEEAGECLRTIQSRKNNERSEQIRQQINQASPEQKAEMYRRIMAASQKGTED